MTIITDEQAHTLSRAQRASLSHGQRRLLAIALTLAAFAWRVHDLGGQSLWRDEVDAVYFALRDLPQTLSMFVQAGQNGALYFLSLRPWLWTVGSSEFALRLPSALFGTLAVPLTWQVARRLISGRADNADASADSTQPAADRLPLARELPPLLAALFIAANPYQLWYSQEGKMYALITALTLLATLFWLDGIGQGTKNGGWRSWLGYLVTVSIAIYSHLLMIMLLPLHLLWFLIAWPQSRTHWRGYGLAMVGLTLPYLPMVIWQWDLLTAGEKRTGFNFTPMPEMVEKIALGHARGFMPPGELIWLTPIFFLGLAGLLMGFLEIGRPKPDPHPHLSAGRRYLLTATWLLIPILTIFALSLRQPIFTARYVIWIAPAVMMLMALGVQLVWKNGGLIGKPLAALLVVYVVGFWLYAGWQQKSQPIKYDLRSAVTTIAAQRSPDDLLILQIPHMEYAYRYYSSELGPRPFAGSDERLGRWAGGLWTNNGQSDDQARAAVDQQMLEVTAGADDIWVMRSEVEMWDPRYLMDEWLDQHATMIDESIYHGAQVQHYQLNGNEE